MFWKIGVMANTACHAGSVSAQTHHKLTKKMDFFVNKSLINATLSHPDCRFPENEIRALWMKLHQAGMRANGIITPTLYQCLFSSHQFFANRLFELMLDKEMRGNEHERDGKESQVSFVNFICVLSFMSPNATIEVSFDTSTLSPFTFTISPFTFTLFLLTLQQPTISLTHSLTSID
jgi:hypothetical protein